MSMSEPETSAKWRRSRPPHLADAGFAQRAAPEKVADARSSVLAVVNSNTALAAILNEMRHTVFVIQGASADRRAAGVGVGAGKRQCPNSVFNKPPNRQ